MSVIDFKSDIDTQAWALLEADVITVNGKHFSDYFPAQCRKKDDNVQPMQSNIMLGANDRNFIEIKVSNANPISSNGGRSGLQWNFGMNQSTFSSAVVDFVVPLSCTLSVTMTFDQATDKKSERFNAEALVRQTWMHKFPGFGLDYCSDFSISERRRNQTIDGIARFIVEQTLQLNLRPYLSTLGG